MKKKEDLITRVRPEAPKYRKGNPTGERLQKAIEDLYDRNLINNRIDFANQINVADYVLYRIIMGALPLTKHTAAVIEKRFGISAKKLLAPRPKPRAKYKKRRKKAVPVKKPAAIIAPKIDSNSSLYTFKADEALEVPAPAQRLKRIMDYLIVEGGLRFKTNFATLIDIGSQELLRLENGQRKLSSEIASRIARAFGIQPEWLLFGMRRQDTTPTIPESLKKHIEEVRKPEDYLAPRPARLLIGGEIPAENQRFEEIMLDLARAGLVKSRRHFARVIGEEYLILNSLVVGDIPITQRRGAVLQKIGISPAWVVFGVGKKYMKEPE